MKDNNIHETEPCIDEQLINVKVVLEIKEANVEFSINDTMTY